MNKAEIFDEIINQASISFSFLTDNQYVLHEIDREYKTRYNHGEDLCITFINEKLNKNIEIVYYHLGGNDNRVIDKFSFRINAENKYINFSNYMLLLKKIEIGHLMLEEYEGEYPEKISKLLNKVSKLMQEHMSNLLFTEHWEEVPMNWYGTK